MYIKVFDTDLKIKFTFLVRNKKIMTNIYTNLKESHGFDEENEYVLGFSIVTNQSLIEDTFESEGLEVDWNYINKVSSELDYAIERKFAKEIGNVAVEEFHDDNSYNCTFWVRFDDIKANKYMKNLSYFDDYTRGNSTVFMYDIDEILDNEIDKLEKKYDSDILGILRECVTVEIEVPTESVFYESKNSVKKSLKEKLSNEFADLLRQLINSVDELDEYGDIENLFSSSLWLKAFNVRDRAEEILKENGLKI